ncbi:MAG: hypothetical protein QGG36_20155, partial [Pirellulaceae bacterium]|nr:hypothetical protein [Pirellulaceae bacterium]
MNALGFWNAVSRGNDGMERWGAAGAPGSPVLKDGPMPPAAEEGVNALGFWNVVNRLDCWNAVASGNVGMERWGAAGPPGSPVLKDGPMPPAAEEGVNALAFWNVREPAAAEIVGTRWRDATLAWSVGVQPE